MTLDTWFEGDPESCWRTADRLGRLTRATEAAGAFLAEQSGLPEADFEGQSGNTYRASVNHLATTATGGAATQRALAAGLDELATNLDGVRRVLRRARSLAREHLVMHGLTIQEPGPYADDRQRRVFDLVRGAVEEARRVEHQAHHDWQAVLATHTGTPAPAPMANTALPASTVPLAQPEPEPSPGPGQAPDGTPPVGSNVATSSGQASSTTTTSATPSAPAHEPAHDPLHHPEHGHVTHTGTHADDDDWADQLNWAPPTPTETSTGTPTGTPAPATTAMATCGTPNALGEVHSV